MIKSIVYILAMLGVGCFIYIYFWRSAEVDNLLDHASNLIELELYEESIQYSKEAVELSSWRVLIAILGFFLTLPMSFYIVKYGLFKNAKRQQTFTKNI